MDVVSRFLALQCLNKKLKKVQDPVAVHGVTVAQRFNDRVRRLPNETNSPRRNIAKVQDGKAMRRRSAFFTDSKRERILSKSKIQWPQRKQTMDKRVNKRRHSFVKENGLLFSMVGVAKNSSSGAVSISDVVLDISEDNYNFQNGLNSAVRKLLCTEKTSHRPRSTVNSTTVPYNLQSVFIPTPAISPADSERIGTTKTVKIDRITYDYLEHDTDASCDKQHDSRATDIQHGAICGVPGAIGLLNGVSAERYTMEDVRQHWSSESCWIAIQGQVYDITGFLQEHPAGSEILLEHGGSDATNAFNDVQHSEHAYQLLTSFYKGRLIEE